MRNVFLDKEAKQNNTVLKLNGDVRSDYTSKYDPTKVTNEQLKTAQAKNDAVFTLSNQIIELTENNKVSKLDSDIRATWFDVENEIVSDPGRFKTPEGLEEIKELRLLYKGKIDDRIIEDNLSGKNQLEFLTANEEKYRSSELDTQRQTMEIRMDWAVKEGVANTGVYKDAFINNYSNNTYSHFDKLVGTEKDENGKYVRSGTKEQYTFSEEDKTNVERTLNQAESTSKLLSDNTLVGSTILELVEGAYTTSFKNELENLGITAMEEGITLYDFVDRVNSMKESLGDSNRNMKDMTEQIMTIAKDADIDLGAYGDKDLLTNAMNNYSEEFIREKELVLIDEIDKYRKLGNVALNEEQKLKVTNKKTFTNEAISESNTNSKNYYDNGDPQGVLSVFTMDPDSPLSKEEASLMYQDPTASNRLLSREPDKGRFAVVSKDAISAGSDDDIVSMYGEYSAMENEYVETNRSLNRNDELLRSDFRATFMNRDSGVQTGLNMSFLEIDDSGKQEKAIRQSALIDMAESRDVSAVEMVNMKYPTSGSIYDLFREYDILTQSDLDMFVDLTRKLYYGKMTTINSSNERKKRNGETNLEDNIQVPLWLDNPNATIGDVEYFINQMKPNDITTLLDSDTNMLDIYATTESFTPSKIDGNRMKGTTANTKALNYVVDNYSMFLSTPKGRDLLERGYALNTEEIDGLESELKEYGVIDKLGLSKTMTDAVIESLKIGLDKEETNINTRRVDGEIAGETYRNSLNEQDADIQSIVDSSIDTKLNNEEITPEHAEFLKAISKYTDFGVDNVTTINSPREKERITSNIMNNISKLPYEEPTYEGLKEGSTSYDKLVDMVKGHEGYSEKMYPDAGGQSIGYGYHLTAHSPDDIKKYESGELKMTEEKADELLRKVLNTSIDQAKRVPGFDKLNDDRKSIIVDMIYNMGLGNKVDKDGNNGSGLLGFPNMMRNLSKGNYDKVADEMVLSDWYNQTGLRAKKLVNAMRSGTLDLDKGVDVDLTFNTDGTVTDEFGDNVDIESILSIGTEIDNPNEFESNINNLIDDENDIISIEDKPNSSDELNQIISNSDVPFNPDNPDKWYASKFNQELSDYYGLNWARQGATEVVRGAVDAGILMGLGKALNGVKAHTLKKTTLKPLYDKKGKTGYRRNKIKGTEIKDAKALNVELGKQTRLITELFNFDENYDEIKKLSKKIYGSDLSENELVNKITELKKKKNLTSLERELVDRDIYKTDLLNTRGYDEMQSEIHTITDNIRKEYTDDIGSKLVKDNIELAQLDMRYVRINNELDLIEGLTGPGDNTASIKELIQERAEIGKKVDEIRNNSLSLNKDTLNIVTESGKDKDVSRLVSGEDMKKINDALDVEKGIVGSGSLKELVNLSGIWGKIVNVPVVAASAGLFMNAMKGPIGGVVNGLMAIPGSVGSILKVQTNIATNYKNLSEIDSTIISGHILANSFKNENIKDSLLGLSSLPKDEMYSFDYLTTQFRLVSEKGRKKGTDRNRDYDAIVSSSNLPDYKVRREMDKTSAIKDISEIYGFTEEQYNDLKQSILAN